MESSLGNNHSNSISVSISGMINQEDSGNTKEGNVSEGNANGANRANGESDYNGYNGKAQEEGHGKAEGNEFVNEEPIKTLDSLFKKTETKPHIYYLPLTEEEVQEKKMRMKKGMI